jgi:hypothetical protein
MSGGLKKGGRIAERWSKAVVTGGWSEFREHQKEKAEAKSKRVARTQKLRLAKGAREAEEARRGLLAKRGRSATILSDDELGGGGLL